MQITASAISLNVDDVTAAALIQAVPASTKCQRRLVSLSRQDAGFNLIFLRTGLATFKPAHMRERTSSGWFAHCFVVDDIDREYARLPEGVSITTAIRN